MVSTKTWQAPATWTKYGEIFSDEDERSVFVCSPCSAATRFGDAVSFWAHVQKRHIDVITCPSMLTSTSTSSSSSDSSDFPYTRIPKRPIESSQEATPVSSKKQKMQAIVFIDIDDEEETHSKEMNAQTNSGKNGQKQQAKQVAKISQSEEENDVIKHMLDQVDLSQNVLPDKSFEDVIMDCKVESELIAAQSIALKKLPLIKWHGEIIDLDDEDNAEDTKYFRIENEPYTEELYKLMSKEVQETTLQHREESAKKPEEKQTEIVQKRHESGQDIENIEPINTELQRDLNYEIKHWTLESEKRNDEQSLHMETSYGNTDPTMSHCRLDGEDQRNKKPSHAEGIHETSYSKIQHWTLEVREPSDIVSFNQQTPKKNNMENSPIEGKEHKDEDLFCIARKQSVLVFNNNCDYIELSDDEEDAASDEIMTAELRTNKLRPEEANSSSTLTPEPSDNIVKSATITSYACKLEKCNKIFSSDAELKEHKQFHDEYKDKTTLHHIPTPEPSPNNMTTYTPPPPTIPTTIYTGDEISTGDQPFTCNFCPKTFCQPWQLNNHHKVHLKTTERQEKRQSVDKPPLIVEMPSTKAENFKVTSRPFKCQCCGKRTCTEKAMEIHQIRFHRAEPDDQTMDCETCGKRVLRKHMPQHSITHTNIHTFYCMLCPRPRPFKQKCSLSFHMKKYHTKGAATSVQAHTLPPVLPTTSSSLLLQNSSSSSGSHGIEMQPQNLQFQSYTLQPALPTTSPSSSLLLQNSSSGSHGVEMQSQNLQFQSYASPPALPTTSPSSSLLLQNSSSGSHGIEMQPQNLEFQSYTLQPALPTTSPSSSLLLQNSSSGSHGVEMQSRNFERYPSPPQLSPQDEVYMALQIRKLRQEHQNIVGRTHTQINPNPMSYVPNNIYSHIFKEN